MIKLPIYFDYAATTPVDSRVAEKMSRYLTQDVDFGNAASSHVFGQNAKRAVDDARGKVANLISAEPREIVWTSGATESNNLALRGVASLYQRKGTHIVTVKTEHPSVIECCQQLEKEGFSVTYLSPEKNGLLDLDKFQQALRPDTILASIMHVNNETGIIQDIAAIANITSSRGILFHVDAVQSAGKIPIDLGDMSIDLMSFSAHKVYGPKGMGALYVRAKPRVRVAPLILGGGQEMGMRSGTLPTHQIVGMGEAFAIAKSEMTDETSNIKKLRDHLWQRISSAQSLLLNNDFKFSVPHIINLRIKGIKAEKIIESMPEIAISAGSACQSKGIEPSYVLRAMGLSHEEAEGSIRISLGRFSTKEQVDYLVDRLIKAN